MYLSIYLSFYLEIFPETVYVSVFLSFFSLLFFLLCLCLHLFPFSLPPSFFLPGHTSLSLPSYQFLPPILFPSSPLSLLFSPCFQFLSPLPRLPYPRYFPQELPSLPLRFPRRRCYTTTPSACKKGMKESLGVYPTKAPVTNEDNALAINVTNNS